MPRSQLKSMSINNQHNIPPLEANNPIVLGPEKGNLSKAQDKYFQTAIVNILKDLREDMNKYLNEYHENTVG